MCATFIFTYLNQHFGRRKTILFGALICIITNSLSCIAIHWIYLAIIRIGAGLGSSIIMTTMPILFGESLNPNIKLYFFNQLFH